MKIQAAAYQESGRAKNIFITLFQKESPEKDTLFLNLPASYKKTTMQLWKSEFRGEKGETKSVWFPKGRINRIRLFGLGDKTKWNRGQNSLIARRYVQYAKSELISEFVTSLDNMLVKSKKEAAIIFTVNALMAQFEFIKYKEKPKEEIPEIKTIYLAVDNKDIDEVAAGIKEGIIIGEEVNGCRILANTPGGDITPEKLAGAAKTVAQKTGLTVKILDEKEIKKIGMGGITGVSRGSDEKPRFIILEYKKGPKGQKPLVLVGKGVTFDTGGLNLKPDQYMYEMHMDMSGGAAVIHGLAAIARLKLPINAVGLIPAVENCTSGSSYRPGDILKSLSGKTIEVLNTDAEGRIILADALTYALRYKPGFILDLATLTGAAHVALGNYCSALFSNDGKLHPLLAEIGQNSGDYVWPLPLWDEYLSEIKGTFADLSNIAKSDRYGGAIHGAKFLEQFVENTPWAHLDIAPKMTTIDSELLSKGASGVGVRYIVELAQKYAAGSLN